MLNSIIKIPEEWLDDPNFQRVPTDVVQAIWHYVDQALDPGGFATALLARDIAGATLRVHPLSKNDVAAIADWIAAVVPPNAQGSYDVVRSWYQRTSLFRQDAWHQHRAWLKLQQS